MLQLQILLLPSFGNCHSPFKMSVVMAQEIILHFFCNMPKLCVLVMYVYLSVYIVL
jgi:hypothetical protein